MRRTFTLIAIAFTSLCLADDPGKRVQQLYDASDYSGAIRCLEGLIKGGLSGRERDIARYNLATTYLANREWQRALTELGRIELGDDPPPLFVLRLHANQAVAYWTGAELTAADLDQQEQNPLGRCDEALALLDKAWKEWMVATSAACELARLEGDAKAPLPKELSEMREGIKERQARLRQLRTALHVRSIPYSELLSTVRQGVTASISVLDQVGSGRVDENGRMAYLLQLGLKGKRLMALWEGLEQRVEERLHQAEQEAEERHGAPFESLEEMRKEPEVARAIQSQHLLMAADAQFRRSLQFIKMADEWQARACQAIAAINLEILELFDQGGDPLYAFLWERHRLASQLAETTHQELQLALQQERQETEQFCLTAAQGISSQLPPLEGALMEQLIERIGDAEATLSQIEYDPFYYLQMMTPEEVTLVTLREEAIQRSGSHHLTRLRALREKFEMRSLIEEAEYEKVVFPLQEAERAAQGAIAWDQLKVGVDQALRCWSPVVWLGVHVDELCEGARSWPIEQLASACDPLIQVARSEGLDPITTSLSACRSDLNEGRIQLSHDHPGCFAVCMLDAWRWMELSRDRLGEQAGQTPAAPLAQAIEEQKHALALNLKSQEAGRSETLFESVISISGRAQKEVVSIAEAIPKESFADDPEKSSLFQSGLGAAKRAEAGLGVRWPNWEEIREEQERAIELWTKLQDQQGSNGGSGSQEGSGSDSHSGDSSGEQKEGGEGAEAESTEEESSSYFGDCPQEFPPQRPQNVEQPQSETSAREEVSPTQVFEWLQQMDQEDRPPARSDGNVRQGVHPW